MSETLIQDNTLKGSPILSYGHSGPKRVWSGLFGLFAAIVASLFILLSILFWFFTKIPVPDDAVLLAVLPPGTQLPASAPSAWLEAVNRARIFPVLVGFEIQKDGSRHAFAVRSPSVFDIHFLKTGQWPLTTPDVGRKTRPPSLRSGVAGAALDVGRQGYESPARLFGWPFGQKNIQLTIDLKKIFSSPGTEFKDLPEVLSGPLESNVWRTSLVSNETFSYSKDVSDFTSFAPIAGSSPYIKNAFASQGVVFDSTESGVLAWNRVDFVPGYSFLSSDTLSDDEKVSLLQAKGIFDLKDQVLPDGTLVKHQAPPFSEIASNTHLFAQNSFEFTIPSAVLGAEQKVADTGIECPGNVIAVFDEMDVENMCSWLGFCFGDAQKLVVAQENSHINFCYGGL